MRKVKTDFTGAKNETLVTGRRVVGSSEEGTASTQQLKRKTSCKYFAAHF